MSYVGALKDGTPYAPRLLENKLKFLPYIREAVASGDGRDMVCALIDIEMEATSRWADKLEHLRDQGPRRSRLAGAEVYELVAEGIAKVNADLAQEPALAKSQIHRFVILHGELSRPMTAC